MGIISWPCSHSLFPRLGVSSLSDLYYAKQHFWTMFWYGIDSEHYHGKVPEVFLFPVSSCGSSLITPYSSYRLISACSYFTVWAKMGLLHFWWNGSCCYCHFSPGYAFPSSRCPNLVWILSFGLCGTFIHRVLVETSIEIIEYCLSKRVAMSGTGKTVVTVKHCSNI